MLAPEQWLRRGWRAFVLNVGAFVGATFILAVSAALTAGPLFLGAGSVYTAGEGLAAGLTLVPLWLGLLEMALRARRGDVVAAWEIIRGFRFFLPGVVFWGVGLAAGYTLSACRFLPVVGAMVGLLAGPFLYLFSVLTAFCIVDRGAGVREALGRVLLVVEREWLGLWAISLLFLFLQNLGGLFFGVGFLATVTWIACAWAAAYQDLFERP